jgi:hypothetical protein
MDEITAEVTLDEEQLLIASERLNLAIDRRRHLSGTETASHAAKEWYGHYTESGFCLSDEAMEKASSAF